MKSLKKKFDFYVFSNIHVGIATTCLVVISEGDVSGVSIPYSSYFVFFSTVLAYHFIRLFENCSCRYNDVLMYLKRQPIEVFLVGLFSLIGGMYFGVLIGGQDLLIVLPVVLLTFFYVFPIFKLKGRRISLRNYPTIKILAIAVAWAMITVLFPLQDAILNSQVWLEFLQRFFLIMALVIPFDIRDLHHDAPHLQTIPQKIGIRKTKWVGVFFLVIFMGLSILKNSFEVRIIIIEFLVFVVSLLFLIKSKEIQSKYYTSFWVESVPIIWLALIWVNGLA